jgi:hypothetical protein
MYLLTSNRNFGLGIRLVRPNNCRSRKLGRASLSRNPGKTKIRHFAFRALNASSAPGGLSQPTLKMTDTSKLSVGF